MSLPSHQQPYSISNSIRTGPAAAIEISGPRRNWIRTKIVRGNEKTYPRRDAIDIGGPKHKKLADGGHVGGRDAHKQATSLPVKEGFEAFGRELDGCCITCRW